jgi:hypothetical protein
MTSRHLSTITVAIALLSSLAALAPAQAADNGTLTRAEVQAEAQRALRAGELNHRHDDYQAFAAPVPAERGQGASRALVRAEAASAIASGQLRYVDDGYQVFVEPVTASTRSRADVRAELEQARASGDLDRQQAQSHGYELPQASQSVRRDAPVVRADGTTAKDKRG